jgi:calcium channel MID1
MRAQLLWPLSASLLLSLPFALSQNTQTALSFKTPVTLAGNNFSTSSAPVLFSLPSSSSQISISLALCAVASSNPPRIFATNSSSSSQPVVPGPNGGPDVFEVTITTLGLGDLTLDLPTGSAAAGVLAVYGGSTSDSLEIGVSQGGECGGPLSSVSLPTHPTN